MRDVLLRTVGGPSTALAAGVCAALVTVLAPGPAVGVAVVVMVAGALLASPDRGTLVALGLLYLNAGVVLVNVHGLPGPVAAAPIVLLLLPMTHHLVVLRASVVWLPATTWCAAFGLVYIASALTAPTMSQTGPFVVTFLTEGFGLFLLVTNVVRSPPAVRRSLQAIVVAGAAMGGVSLTQYLRGMYWTSFGGFGSVGDRYVPGDTEWTNYADGTLTEGHARLAGPLGEANFFALILIVLLPYGLYLAFSSSSWVQRSIWVGATVLVGVGVVLTYSRGAIVAIVLTTVALSVLRVVPRRSLVWMGVIGAVALTLVPSYGERLGEIKTALHLGGGSHVVHEQSADAAARGRLSEVVAALEVYRDHPVLGVGPGQFPSYYQLYAGDAAGGVHSGEGGRQAHNLVAGLAAETGTLGLVTFFGGVLGSLHKLLLLRRRPEAARLATAAIASMTLLLSASMFLHLAYMRYLWLHLALAAVLPAVVGSASRRSAVVSR